MLKILLKVYFQRWLYAIVRLKLLCSDNGHLHILWGALDVPASAHVLHKDTLDFRVEVPECTMKAPVSVVQTPAQTENQRREALINQHQNTTEMLGRGFYRMTFCSNRQCGGESYDISSPKSSILRLSVEIKGSFWSGSDLKSKSITTSGNSMCIGCSVIESLWLGPGDRQLTVSVRKPISTYYCFSSLWGLELILRVLWRKHLIDLRSCRLNHPQVRTQHAQLSAYRSFNEDNETVAQPFRRCDQKNPPTHPLIN